jgi:hypothetical protein
VHDAPVKRPAVLALLALARVAAADPDPDEVIEVTGKAPEEPLHTELAPEELHNLPGGGNDALRGLASLPGVARIPFGLGGLALRGAAPHDTRVFLDGIEVPILYHFGGLASFVPIDALERVELTPSGFDARWGRGIGGVVLLDSRSPHPTRWTSEGEVSLLHAGVLATGPASDGGSWVLGVRRSYIDFVLATAEVDFIAPSYTDAQVRWQSGDSKWTAIAFASDDGLSFENTGASNTGGVDASNVKSLDYTSRFARIGLRYASGGATITPWVGVDDYLAQANHKGIDKGYTRTDYDAGLRAELAASAFGGLLRLGIDGKATHYDYSITGTPPPSPLDPDPQGVITRDGTQESLDVGAFLEEDWPVAGGRASLKPGVRIDRFGLADRVVVDPRVAVVEQLGDGVSLTETVGAYHEPPLVTDLDPIFGKRQLAPPSSMQASVAAEAPIFGLFVGKATAYAQVQDDLPVDVVSGATPISDNGGEQAGGLLAISRELVDEQFGSYSYREYIGHGRAWGLELLARREIGKLTGWVSYTYARAFRTGNPKRDEHYYPYVLDQPHQLIAVATRSLGVRWRIGGRLRFTSGNPITPVATAYYDANHMKWTAVDGPLLSERLPVFAQLDLRIDRVWPNRRGVWDLYFDVQNATARENVEGVTYSADFSQRLYTHGLPIFPSIGLEYRPNR